MLVVGVLACLLLGFALISRRLEATIVTAPMVFVAAGLVAQWTGVVDFGAATRHDEPAHGALFLVAELALVLLLFSDAARIDPRALRGNWFGPRGLASIILAFLVIEEAPGLTGLDEIFLTMTVTVLLSVFLHGVTAAPLTRWYAARAP